MLLIYFSAKVKTELGSMLESQIEIGNRLKEEYKKLIEKQKDLETRTKYHIFKSSLLATSIFYSSGCFLFMGVLIQKRHRVICYCEFTAKEPSDYCI